MSMLNWQGWAANWLGWGSSGVTPPAVESGGGDRGVVLFREEKKQEPERLRIPPPVTIRARTRQAPQESKAVVEVESELRLASWSGAVELRAEIETETSFSFQTEQRQVTEVLVTAGRVQGPPVPVKPYFEAARARAETCGGRNEAKALIEIE